MGNRLKRPVRRAQVGMQMMEGLEERTLCSATVTGVVVGHPSTITAVVVSTVHASRTVSLGGTAMSLRR